MKSQRLRETIMRALLDGQPVPDLTDGATQAALEYLAAEGYVSVTRDSSHTIRYVTLRPYGQVYFDVLAEKRRERKIEWFRYAVTTLIAMAALVVSIVALILNLYMHADHCQDSPTTSAIIEITTDATAMPSGINQAQMGGPPSE